MGLSCKDDVYYYAYTVKQQQQQPPTNTRMHTSTCRCPFDHRQTTSHMLLLLPCATASEKTAQSVADWLDCLSVCLIGMCVFVVLRVSVRNSDLSKMCQSLHVLRRIAYIRMTPNVSVLLDRYSIKIYFDELFVVLTLKHTNPKAQRRHRMPTSSSSSLLLGFVREKKKTKAYAICSALFVVCVILMVGVFFFFGVDLIYTYICMYIFHR